MQKHKWLPASKDANGGVARRKKRLRNSFKLSSNKQPRYISTRLLVPIEILNQGGAGSTGTARCSSSGGFASETAVRRFQLQLQNKTSAFEIRQLPHGLSLQHEAVVGGALGGDRDVKCTIALRCAWRLAVGGGSFASKTAALYSSFRN